MALVFELELPAFDYLDPDPRGAPSQLAHAIRRFALLPGGEPRPGGATGGAGLPRTVYVGLALDGEPEFDSITGIYGLRALPIRYDGSAQR